jgi:Tfp pilus assembly protein FimT
LSSEEELHAHQQRALANFTLIELMIVAAIAIMAAIAAPELPDLLARLSKESL